MRRAAAGLCPSTACSGDLEGNAGLSFVKAAGGLPQGCVAAIAKHALPLLPGTGRTITRGRYSARVSVVLFPGRRPLFAEGGEDVPGLDVHGHAGRFQRMRAESLYDSGERHPASGRKRRAAAEH